MDRYGLVGRRNAGHQHSNKKQLQAEIKGTLKEQIAMKKDLLKKMLLENAALQQMKVVASSASSLRQQQQQEKQE
jgi:hypothetical protein